MIANALIAETLSTGATTMPHSGGTTTGTMSTPTAKMASSTSAHPRTSGKATTSTTSRPAPSLKTTSAPTAPTTTTMTAEEADAYVDSVLEGGEDDDEPDLPPPSTRRWFNFKTDVGSHHTDKWKEMPPREKGAYPWLRRVDHSEVEPIELRPEDEIPASKPKMKPWSGTAEIPSRPAKRTLTPGSVELASIPLKVIPRYGTRGNPIELRREDRLFGRKLYGRKRRKR